MSRAIVTPTTPDACFSPAPAATRRGALAALAWGAIATPIAAIAATGGRALAASADPVVALYARWLAADTACHAARSRHEALRAEFVGRYGGLPGRTVSVWRAWEADPQYAELKRHMEESDSQNEESLNILETMIETPAVSVEGAICKVRVLAKFWTYALGKEAGPDFDEELTLAFVRDAVRVLDAGRTA